MRPLDDIRVLDLTWVLSGPYASMLLCDLGADVVKMERPPWGDIARTTSPYVNGRSGYFFSINRGKRSLAVDLQQPAGRDLFLRLVEKADVVMENFTPGTMDRLGVGYETLATHNPQLIYAATSGFGQTGPYRDKPALDVIIQGMGGIMSITGEPGGNPVRPGASLGDIAAGLFTALAITSALHERGRSGQGQMIDISMLDCQVSVLENAYMRYFLTGKAPEPLGTRHPSATPFQAFPTADGHVVVAMGFGTENQWALLCGVLGLVELIDDQRFDTSPKRTLHHGELEPLLNEAFRARTTAEWVAELEALGIPCGPLNRIDEAARDPQLAHRNMLVDVEKQPEGVVRIANTPFRMSRSESGIKGPPPEVGEHTREVLTEWLRMDSAAVEQLVDSGVLATEGGPDIEALLA
jgi:CoA:oxalate CoA-transferase